MAGNVGSLNVRVGADISGLTEGMERAQRTVKRGADAMGKSAQASAQVFEKAGREADALKAAIDPLFAAQLRYNREFGKAQELLSKGALTAQEVARIQAGLKAQLDGTTASLSNMSKEAARAAAALSTPRSGKSAEDSASAFMAADTAAKQFLASIDPLYAAQLRYNTELAKADALLRNGAISAGQFSKAQVALKGQLDSQLAALNGTAQAADRAAKEQLQLSSAANILRGKLDPMFLAQKRFDDELTRAEQLLSKGVISQREYGAAVALARQELQQHAASVAGTVKSNADFAVSGGRVTTSAGQMRAGLQQLGFQFGDVAQGISMGTKASTIFAQQSGQVIQSLQLMGGEGNKFLRFLGGPWGLALSAATVLLTPLIAKLFETKDETGKLIDKMREQARQAALNEKADEAWKRTIEGLTQAIRERRKEQERSLRTDIQAEQSSLDQARGEVASQRSNLQKLRGDLQRELAEYRRIMSGPLAPNADAAAVQLADRRSQGERVRQLTAQLRQAQAAVAEAEKNVRGAQAPIGERNVAARIDPIQRATDEYTRTLGNLRTELQAGSISQKQFEDRLESAKRKLDAVKEAAKGSAKAVGEMGRQVSQAEAASIAKAAGFQVNSAGRSTARQKQLYDAWVARGRPKDTPVAPPGTSAHEGAKGRWALDIQITNKSDIGRINKVFAEKGIALTKRILEHGGRVLHVEGSRGEAAAAESAIDKAERDRIAAAERAAKQQNDFNELRASLNGQLLQAQNEIVRGIQGQAKVATDQIEDERGRRELAIRNDLAEGKYGDATSKLAQGRAEQLLELNNGLASQRRANVFATKMEAIEAIQFRISNEEMDRQIEALRFRDEMAATQREHRRAQRAILDAVYAQRKAELEHEKQLAIRNGATQQEIDAIQAKIDDLKNQRGRDDKRTDQATRGPLEDYRNSLPLTADQMNEAMENVAVRGLQSLEDGLMSVLDGTKSVKEAFHEMAKAILADLIRIAIQKYIIGTIMQVTGMGAPAPLPGYANGTNHARGGWSVVGERGPEIVNLPRGSQVIPNHELNGMNGAARINMPIMIDATGADAAGLARVRAEVENLKATLPATIVGTVQDAKSRFIIR